MPRSFFKVSGRAPEGGVWYNQAGEPVEWSAKKPKCVPEMHQAARMNQTLPDMAQVKGEMQVDDKSSMYVTVNNTIV